MREHTSVTALGVLLALMGAGSAQGAAPETKPAPWSFSAAVTGQEAFSAGLRKGGTLTGGRLAVSLGVSRRFVPAFSASVSAGHELQEWAFDAPLAFAGPIPWGTVVRSNVGLGLNLALSSRFVVGASPFLEWAYAREAGAGDALTGGAALSAFGIFSPRFTLGGGAKVQKQFFSTKLTPFVIVNWQLTPRWRIANASSSGPLGSGGVELRYSPGETWELAAGGVYRSLRFRLDPRGPGPGDIGETGGIPILVRASGTFARGLRADVHYGVHLNGRVEHLGPDGDEIAKDDLATRTLAAFSLSSKW